MANLRDRKVLRHSLPSASTPLVFRNKSLSYACLNTVRTWFWGTNETSMRCYHLEDGESFTALEKLPDDSLILGTSKGRLHAQEQNTWFAPHPGENITELVAVGSDHVIIKLENKHKSLVTLLNGSAIVEFDEKSEVCRFRDNMIALVRGNAAELRAVNDYSLQCSRTIGHDCSDIRVEQDAFILMKHKNKRGFTIWDVEGQSHLDAPLESYNNTDQFQCLVFVSPRQFFVPNFAGDKRMRLERFMYKEEENKWDCESRSSVAGCVVVTSMKLIGNSIAYVTEPQYLRPSDAPSSREPYFCVYHEFNMEGELILSDFTLTLDVEPGPLRLIPLKPNFFALRCAQSIFLFKNTQSIFLFKNTSCRSRLFIGEGNFIYTEALIRKHEIRYPDLARAITATEKEGLHLVSTYFDGANRRLEELRAKGVTIRFEIDAQNIHEIFVKQRFKRIHWNCPFRDNVNPEDFKKVIPNFFKSCRQIQNCGDRVHITLMQEKFDRRDGYDGPPNYWQVRQKQNPIVSGSLLAGYRLIRKRVFGERRYPGYEHRSTSNYYKLNSLDEDMREFVFEKISFYQEYKSSKDHSINKKENQYSDAYYFECNTDYDSSTYEDSSDDEMGNN